MCDGVRGCAGASGTDLPSTDLPSPPAVPLALLPVIFSFSSNYPRHVIRARSFSLLYSPLVPPALALPHRPVCSISLPPPPSPHAHTHSLRLSLVLLHSPAVSSRLTHSVPFPLRLPLALSLPLFRCHVCSLFPSSLVVFLSSSLFRARLLALSASRTNYLCLISDTVDAKR